MKRARIALVAGIPVAAIIGFALWHLLALAAVAPGQIGVALTAFAFGILTVLVLTHPSTPSNVIAGLAIDGRRLIGLDPARLKSMARLRRSHSGAERALAVIAIRAAIGATLASNLARRIAARLLDLLGAVTAAAQPRFVTSLVAGSAASSAA